MRGRHTVSELSGQSIPFAAKVSFGNVVNITDAIGGVEVCIGGDGIDDPDAGIDWEPGPRVVKGYDALRSCARARASVTAADLARIGNQQQYLSRLINKLRSDEVLSNPGTLIGLANTAVNNIEPSESLADPIRIAQLAYTLKDVPFSDITFVQFPVVDDPADNNRVIPDQTSAGNAVGGTEHQRSPAADRTGGGPAASSPIPPHPTQRRASPPPRRAPTAPDATDASARRRGGMPSNVSGTKANQATCSAGNG